MSFGGWFGIIGNLYIGIENNILVWKLPLHLCSFTAMFLPFAAKSKKGELCSAVCLWSIGALIAVVLNDEAVGYEMGSLYFAVYFWPHLIEFTVPLLMLALHKFKTTFKDIVWSWLLTNFIYCFVYLMSETLTYYVKPVNYMFTMGPTNFVTQFFYDILPLKMFYMYLIFPIIAALSMLIHYISKDGK